MTEKEFNDLTIGDIVRHKTGADGYVITSSNGRNITAVRTIDIANPIEWDLILKSNH